MKVYCRDCQYLILEKNIGVYHCVYPDNIQEHDTTNWLEEKTEKRDNNPPKELNKYNSCQWYKTST